MGHTKNPTLQVAPRFPQLQMPEKRQEHLLNDLFPIVDRQSTGDHVAQQWIAKLLEEMDDLAFTLRGFRRRSRSGARRENQLADRICRRYQHEALIYIFPFATFCSKQIILRKKGQLP